MLYCEDKRLPFLLRLTDGSLLRLKGSAESELYTVKEAIQDIIRSRNFLEFLGYPSNIPTPIYEDNQAVIFLSDTITVHPRTKHLNKILNFVSLIN